MNQQAAATSVSSRRAETTVEIDRRANLSQAEFLEKYLYPKKPVVITDAMCEWTALSRWTPEFFKATFGDMKFTIDQGTKAGNDYRNQPGSVEYTMRQFIDLVLESSVRNPAPYFRNRVFYDLFPTLAHDIDPLPEYFEPNWLPEHYLVGPMGRVLNRGAALELYIGGEGASFPVLHYDGGGTHAFLMQIYGRKKFIVYPPEQEIYLYPSLENPNFSTVNSLDNPDLQKFPLFANATATTFILEPGELLFVPSHWWHTTKMLTPSITLSINTANQSNWHELVSYYRTRRRGLVSIAIGLYLTGAGAWRSWRDGRNHNQRKDAPSS
jgi:hypothetical protein